MSYVKAQSVQMSTYFSISFRISSILIPSLLFMVRMPTVDDRAIAGVLFFCLFFLNVDTTKADTKEEYI